MLFNKHSVPWPLLWAHMPLGDWGCNFRYVFFKVILLIDIMWMSCEISLSWMSHDFINDTSRLIYVMGCCRQALQYISWHDDVIKWNHFPRYWPFVIPVPGEFPAQRPVTRSFDVFFDLRLKKPLRKQSWGWWFDTPSRPLWRHCNGYIIFQTVAHMTPVMITKFIKFQQCREIFLQLWLGYKGG